MKHFFVPLCLAAILGCLMTTKAETVEVDSAQKLIEVFEASSGNVVEKDIVLLDDLDFSESGLNHPLGVGSNGECVAYSGQFQGNGHSIKGLVMNNENNEGYKGAGLFCNLKDAAFDGLVLDESCSFNGTMAGGLSVLVSGPLTITNSRIKAAVSGVDQVGGFIGIVEFNNTEIVFENCVSEGNVTGNCYIGGFIGHVDNSFNTTVNISNCINNGNITGHKSDVGGFVGYVTNNNNLTLYVDNCTNNGLVSGKLDLAGFFGYVTGNEIINITLTNSVNNGNVNGILNQVAGFVGVITKCNGVFVTLSHLQNNGNITGENSSVGGLCGLIIICPGIKVTITNCINNGMISGNRNVGGLIGYFSDITISSVFNCTNNGNVAGGLYVGAFLGYFWGYTNLFMTISYFTNNGNITGNRNGGAVGYICGENFTMSILHSTNKGVISQGTSIGGFLGLLSYNKHTNVELINCTNDNSIVGRSNNHGGLIGSFEDNEDINITISKCFNRGKITEGSREVGGLIGYVVRSTGMNIFISNSSVDSEIRGSDDIGGFIGVIDSKPGITNNALVITNSENKGNVSSSSKIACGLFCVSQSNIEGVASTLFNSINKGSVNATTNGYGITNIITKARNVVSMGEVTGPSGSFTFWNTSIDADLFFGMDGKCVNCTDGTTLFVHNTNTGFYEVESGEHVHDLLNAEVEKQNYGMFWTKELDLVESYVEPSPSPSPLASPSSQSGGLSGGNKHGVSLFLIGVVVALAAHVAMAQ